MNHNEHFLSGIITSNMRINILMRLFINPSNKVYLRELAREFNASPSHIKEELHQLSTSQLLTKEKNGRKVLFSANDKHPIYSELHSMVRKALGMDRIIESIIRRLGNLEKAILVGDYADGKDTGVIDLILIGNINQNNLLDLTNKTEKYIERKIRTLVLSSDEYTTMKKKLEKETSLILWENGTPK